MKTQAYQVDMTDYNAKVRAILSQYGEPTNDQELSFLCWMTEEEAGELYARYSEILAMRPIVEPKHDGKPMEQFSIRLPAHLVKFAEALGAGNRSAGIVAALEQAKARGKVRRKPSPAKIQKNP